MVPRRYSSEAIVLASRRFSEADRILVVFTKSYGKISLIAKGIRKPKSKKRGSLEVFTRVKFAASRGKNLDIITEVEIIDSYNGIRKNLKKVTVAYFFLEVIGRIIQEGEKNEKLYEILISYLNKLRKEKSLKNLRKEFIYQVLVTLGYWPKGRVMVNPDYTLEEVIEREIFSARVGKKLLS